LLSNQLTTDGLVNYSFTRQVYASYLQKSRQWTVLSKHHANLIV